MLKKIILSTLTVAALWSCKSTKQNAAQPAWFSMATIEGVEIYVDTTSIKHVESVAYASEKRVYVTNDAKKAYIDKIRKEYAKMGKASKADKWNNFSYCIYHCLYECTNKRFRILSVEDFDSAGNRIAKTQPAKGVVKWLNVENETVGDYTFFYICDYE